MRPALFFSPVTILDCGARCVTLGRYRRRGGKGVTETWAARELPADVRDEKSWLAQTELAIAGLGPGRGSVVILVPEARTLLRMLTLPPGTREQGDAIVRIEAEHNLPFAEHELTWGHIETGPTGVGRLALLVAARRVLVERLCAAAELAGWDVRAVWPAALAKLAASERVAQAADQLVVIASEGDWLVTRKTAAGGWALRRVIPEANAQNAARELSRTEDYFISLGLGRLERVGWLGPIQPWMPELSAAMKAPVGLPANGEASENLALAGVALIKAGRKPTVDLLPPERIAVRREIERWRWHLVSSVLFLTTTLVLAGHYWRAGNQMLADAKRQAGELAMVRARAARQSELRSQLAGLREELHRWQNVAARQSRWTQLFADWQDAVTSVKGAWLERLEREPDQSDGRPMTLRVAGCLREQANVDGIEWRARVAQLLEAMGKSPLVAAIEPVRLDHDADGLVRFEVRVSLHSEGMR